MKTTILLLMITAFLTERIAFSQGSFANLSFESANVSPSQPSNTYISSWDAIPGWNAFVGTNSINAILYNSITIGATSVSLIAANPSGFTSLEGNYSVALQAGIYPGYPGPHPDVSIAQTGVVPASAQSLLFKANLGNGVQLVSLGGTALPFFLLGSFAGYNLYGSDVSTFANQTAELRFTSVANMDGRLNDFYLDAIVFSNQPIPEPSTLGLVALGAVLFASRSRLGKRA